MKGPGIKTLLCLLAVLMTTACATRTANTNSRSTYEMPSPTSTVDEIARLKSENQRRLQENVSEYARLPGSSRMTSQPYINGKAIALSKDSEDKEYSLDSGVLSEATTVVAESPEEVGTIVLVTHRRQKFATYTITGSDHIPAYILFADLTIVDRSIPAVIYKKTFRGERPEEVVDVSRYETEIVGTNPSYKISEFLGKLPHR
jgi:hypothetical protein